MKLTLSCQLNVGVFMPKSTFSKDKYFKCATLNYPIGEYYHLINCQRPASLPTSLLLHQIQMVYRTGH